MFDYFKANEQEQYLFVQLPLMLIKDEQFKSLSDSSKILYSLLLNRTSLSAKNGWTDEQGNVYIIYTLEEIMADLNCWEKKATKAMKELKEIGLVKSIRQGLGKPNIIYVMNFATALKYKAKEPRNPVNTLNCQKDNSRTVITTEQEPVKRTIQELPKGQSINNDFKKIYENDIERESDKSSQSIVESYPQKKNDMTRPAVTDNTTQQNYSEMKKGLPQSQTDQSNGLNERPSAISSNFNQYTTYAEWESRIKKNIYFDAFIQERQPYIKLINEIVYNILDIVTETNDFIILNKKEDKKIRTADARELCLRLRHENILYILEKFRNVTDPVTHKGNYLKSIILSSLKEMESYYQNEYRQGKL